MSRVFVLAAAVLLGGCADAQLATGDGVYCYATLASPNCFTRPVPQDRDRLLGYRGPPPAPPPQRRLGQPLDLPPPPARGWRDDGIESISR